MNVQIKHQRTAVTGGNKVCQVELVDTNHIVHAKKADKLQFHRKGAEKTAGFDVAISPPFSTGGSFPGPGNANMDIDIPANQADGNYKYEISYPYDTGCEVIIPLDPIIIIQPSNHKQLIIIVVTAVSAFIVGVTFAKYFL